MAENPLNDSPKRIEWKPVVCSLCGRVVPGLPTRLGNWSIRDHKNPDGRKCPGIYSVRHRMARIGEA